MSSNHLVGEDGLTDEERNILQTPVANIAPEQRHILVSLYEKKAMHSYAENEKYRAKTKKSLFEENDRG